MHERENRRLTRRMPKAISKTGGVDSNGSSTSCFIKDGRKISVGDCALFKPAEDSPPFIGIIRSWTSESESNIKLRVNWLYRPAEVKLVKGVALEAAPNEVFYSFHSDEIPAASLLHPCKVAFLAKGVELPPGISSFVCRRVYDITNKYLWWLTDQDHIDDPNEVDQLLHKTQLEMHALVEQQQSPRSPKQVNGSAASPLKHSPDSLQNSSSNISSHGKGKKRERGDQSFDSRKRERSSKPDNDAGGHLKSENMFNLEIAKFSEKGGLVDSEAVARLVQLMQPEKLEKKIDLTARCMLAGVIAATEKFDCLNQFVQLRGLFVLNEWLQEVHKGKIGDSGNLKISDKSVDDFLLVLLSALDKLPVDLNALQMCNIGKSVNHLRSHKSSEIQKKARTLVDTWKKRVEEEMLNDEGRSQPDSSYGGNRNPSVSDAVVRSPITHQSSMKSTSVKHFPVESNSKSRTAHSGGGRSTLSPTSTNDSCKDGQYRINANGGSSELEIVAKDGKNSSSSQSHMHSQYSSDQAKIMVPCGKEDKKRSTAGSRSLNKIVGTNKHHKSAYGPSPGPYQDSGSNKNSSMAKVSSVDKVSHSAVDASIQESNNHKLIVKIPNRCQGPVESVVGSLEDSSCRNSRASPPALSEKPDQTDDTMRDNKHDYQQVQEVGGSLTCVQKKSVETKRFHNVSKIVCSPSRDEIKSRKAHDSSSSSMNSSIESFPKISEANASMPARDDGEMNILDTVATNEISMPGNVSPSVSPQRSSKMANNSFINHDVFQHGKLTKVADVDNHMDVCIPKLNEDISKSENIEQSKGGCLEKNGTLFEDSATASTLVSVTSSTERCLGDLGAKIIKRELKIKEKKQNELPVASQKVGGSLEVQDKVKAAFVKDECEQNAQRDTAVCLVSNDDDEKMNVNQGPQIDVALEKGTLVASQYDSMDTSDHPVEESAGTSCQFAANLPVEDKSEKTVVVCDSTTQAGKRILDNKTSVSEKQIQPKGCIADVDQNRSCKDQDLENKESGTSVLQASCDVLLKKELLSTDEGSKSTMVKEVIEGKSGAPTENGTLSAASSGPDVDSKLGFDLNEGFNADEGKNGEPIALATGKGSPLEIPVSSASCVLPASVIVAAAAKGSFVPSDELLWNKREVGWKGSAATSAFRPAEPRKAVEVTMGPSKAAVSESPARFPLDIDLNVADDCSGQEFVVRNSPAGELMTTESPCTTGGLGLDLNKVDEAPEMAYEGRHLTSNIMRVDVSTQHVYPSISNDGAATSKLDFDLNDGPAAEDLPVEQLPSSQHIQGRQAPVQVPLGMRINSSDTGNCLSWYPPGTSYSSVTPSALPDRESFSIVGMGGGGPCVVGGPTPALSFNPDSYRGSGIMSSPALPFHPASFQYPVLPYGTRFPLPTSALAGGSSGNMDPATGSRIPTLPSQLVGNGAAVSFQYPHAYVVSRSVPGLGSNGVIENSHNWGKQGLDLNSGPGVLDIEGKSVSLPSLSRQVTTISPQSFAEEQARMYSMAGGHVKRKEAEGGWNVDKLNFNRGDRIT